MANAKTRSTAIASTLIGALLLGALSIFGCDPSDDRTTQSDSSRGKLISSSPGSPGGGISSSLSTSNTTKGFPVRRNETILIASFNIQVFGEKKLQLPGMGERLAAIIQQFDIVAIQEIRSDNQTLLDRLMQFVNANGARYSFVLGPRLGRTNSKEQYAYIFDTSRIVTNMNATYTIDDSQDLLEREPLVARFVTRIPPSAHPFTFTLVDLHTKPADAKKEMLIMDSVLKSIREFEFVSAGEDDVILLGDLNASPSEFPQLARRPGTCCVIPDQTPTNTRQSKTYDNIVFDRELTSEFTGNGGVLNLCDFFGINTESAELISDHFPIWAEFSISERSAVSDAQRTTTANRAGPTTR